MRYPTFICAVVVTLAAAQAAFAGPPDAEHLRLPQTLTLRDAIDNALSHNVQTLLADARRDEAAGDRAEARSAFLPHLSAEAEQSRQRVNLAAQGMDFSGIPGVDIPNRNTYNSFEARAQLRQSLFDYSAWQRYKSAKVGEKIADDRLAVAREQVAAQAALDYVSALAARESVHAAQADLTLAQSLAELAVDQENVGIATGVDVTRAKSRQARAKARLAQARTDRTRADIQLARTIGVNLDAPLALSSNLDYRPLALGSIDDAVSQAMLDRPEVELAAGQIDQREKQLASARAERLPTVSVSAAYGDSGNTYDENREETYRIGAQVQVPIFDGGAINAHIDSAASRLAQQRIQYRDTRDQVEQDVRVSQRTLTTLGDEVEAARQNLDLAEQELTLARDRFAAGVSDNVEVIDAQASLADARDTRVSALADYARARINLAAATGRAQQFRLNEPVTP